jgi:hypothetical protein
MSEVDEILLTVDNLKQVLENLLMRGLRSAGAAEWNTLNALRSEFTRIGAAHLAERIGVLHDALQNDPRAAAPALLHTQTSLRLFERILTLEAAGDALGALVQAEAGNDGPESP